ncbi:dicer-like protein 2 [Ophiostoma piceae UAMH 11346]|uniref:Dicer-like protein 2 n=1 Tax=Ophiostoma piceae (strain UAMH 11346) TaxID=1262450 RepID=S3CLJ8_OPHP1|nr:dicer-like protein 2 [Ophiostoma piceae UAMH 11346]
MGLMGQVSPMSPVSSLDQPYDNMSLGGDTMAASSDDTMAASSDDTMAASSDDTMAVSSDGRSTISPDGDEAADPLIAASRAYQLEMFEESMRRNIIVAMDTGTGKTRIAILRIRAELERSPPPKIVWFLAPTVLLCGQQYKAISAQIPWAQGKLITGDSNLEAWRERTWDAVLLNVRFVVSTPGVLLDALNHAFVKFEWLALLVFDEAHGCVKDNNGRRIMLNFYQPAKAYGLHVPAILGLTASPVQGKKLDGFEQLEATLDAICVSPTRHREELSFFTHRPSTHRHFCGGENDPFPEPGRNLARLRSLERPADPEAMDLHHLGLVASHITSVTPKIYKWTWKYIEALRRRAECILLELGPWGAEYYIHKVIRRVIRAVSKRGPSESKDPFLIALLQHVDAMRPVWPDVDENLNKERRPEQERINRQFLDGLSSKVCVLAEILQGYHSSQGHGEDKDRYRNTNEQDRSMRGIIFVQQRPMAAVLARIISLHPMVRNRFQAGHVVGTSQTSSGDADDTLYLSPRNPAKALQQFRAHQINLLIATSVIEEGIDIPACNLVICVDELTNLKAFIQRRGRARETNSELHLLISHSSLTRKKLDREWEDLEWQMKKRYEDELREAQHLQEIEAISDVSDHLLQPLIVPKTGARLTAKDAKAHLQHFCSSTSSSAFVDAQPIYRLVDSGDEQGFERKYESSGMTRAFVQLPITLPVHLRRAYSQHAWHSQADAFIDAAFQAYKSLYKAGLLTDHLLPPQQKNERGPRFIEGRSNMAAVSEPFRPWPMIYRQWKGSLPLGDYVYKHTMHIEDDHEALLYETDLILPCALPCAPDPFHIYWSAHSERPWTVYISAAEPVLRSDYDDCRDHTTVLLRTAYGHRWPINDTHRLVRVMCKEEHLTANHIELGMMRPFQPEIFANDEESTPDMTCLVRDTDGTPFIYQGYLETKPPLQLVRKPPKAYDLLPGDIPYVAVRPWPKIVGHLHLTANAKLDDIDELIDGDMDGDGDDGDGDENESSTCPASESDLMQDSPNPRKYRTVLPAVLCHVDNLPMAYVQLGSLLPSLNQVIEAYLVAGELMTATPLRQLAIRNLSLVVTAISTPMARLPTNYEYLEFIGDSVLKVYAVANCAAQNLLAPEGQLSLYRDRLVANSRLSRAALDFGLDKYIIARRWSLRQWRKYCAKLADDRIASATTPPLSTKTLADVVEALIGACYVDSGMPLALQCLRLFQDDYQWQSLEKCRDVLYEAAPDNAVYAPPALEKLLGYTFTKKSLLVEAMTHASCPSELPQNQRAGDSAGFAGACMERLEFIGDAILDHVIVKHLITTQTPLSHARTHLLRTTLVNAAFLGFTAMTFTIVEDKMVIVQHQGKRAWPDPNAAPPEIVPQKFHKPLCAFMRHGAPRDMAPALQAAARRFAALKDDILEALWTGAEYPWALLSRLHAEKFYSDVLEAVIGAIWVDSGSIRAVEDLLEKVGILPYLRRAVEDDVHVMHPKEELGVLTGSAELEYIADEIGGSGRKTKPKVKTGVKMNANAKKTKTKTKTNSMTDRDSDSDSDDEELGDLQDMFVDAIDPGEVDALFSCRLLIDGECVVEVTDGVSREDAKTQAAHRAVEAWKRGEIRRRS